MAAQQTIIDTHFHIWNTSVLTIPVLSLFVGQVKPEYTYADYQQAIKGLNFLKSYYVEVDAIKEQSKQEADMIVSLCHEHSKSFAGATIGADLTSPSFKDYILPYSQQSVVKSVRHSLYLTDPSVIQAHTFRENIRLLATLNMMFDLLMPVEKIMHGVDLVKACPDTTFVVDHCGVCPILADNETKEHWRHGIKEYAKLPNTICKISECGFTNPDYAWQVSDVIDIIRFCLQCFGEDRIVYGTNWPICEITADIHRWLEALNIALQDFPIQYSEKLFRKNAELYYR